MKGITKVIGLVAITGLTLGVRLSPVHAETTWQKNHLRRAEVS